MVATLLRAFFIGQFEMDGVAENTMLAGRLPPKMGLLTPNMFDEFPSNILWLC